MSDYPNNSAARLYASLPEVYRERDNQASLPDDKKDHLFKFFEGVGDVLDQTRHTLHQRYRDNFPDISESSGPCQDWLLPYFADLFAVNLTSPYPDSQRAEISNAVRWAQRKGTLTVINEIADAVTMSEAIICEGWKRVATTARVGMPILPALALGKSSAQFPDSGTQPPSDRMPSSAIAQHPGIPAVTPDFREHSKAVQTDPSNPAVQSWRSGGEIWPRRETSLGESPTEQLFWRQANPHGAPCGPDSYQDVSRRTVDLRDVTNSTGHYHPKRILIYLPPPEGFCTEPAISFTWNEDLDTVIPSSGGQKRSDYIEMREEENGLVVFRNKTPLRVEITGDVNFIDGRARRFERLRFKGKVNLKSGRLEFSQCLLKQLTSEIVQSASSVEPGLNLRDTLAGKLIADKTLVRTEYVTIMGSCTVGALQASDSVFNGEIREIGSINPLGLLNSCVRFSRIHRDNYDALPKAVLSNLTADKPLFYETSFCKTSYGVLAPDTPKSITNGAEDGGEMGAYHAWEYMAQVAALELKLNDYLPAGMTPVILRAKHHCAPGKQI